MARTYKRDSIGRFAGGGGGGGKGGGSAKPAAKAASTRSTNTARAKALQASGTTAIGGRVKAKGFVGGKAAQQRAGGLRASGTTSVKARAFTVGKGGKQSAALRIQGDQDYPELDLRVDDHAEPLDELQRLHDKSLERFQPFIACLATRERPAGELERSRIEAHIDQFHAAWRARA